jgi:hypothetical protein
MKTIEINRKEFVEISEDTARSITADTILNISRKNLTDTQFFQLDNSTLNVYHNDVWKDEDFLVRKATEEELNIFNALSILKPYLKTF